MEKKDKSLKLFLSLLLSTNIPKGRVVLGIIGSVLTTLVGLTIPLFTREIIDGFSIASISAWVIAAIAAAFILQAVIDGISFYLLSYVGQHVVARLRDTMWLKLIHLPVNYFDKTASGESVSRLINDTGVVRELITSHFPQFVSGVISIVGSLIILLIMDWKMTLIMLVSVPVTVAIMIPLGRSMSKISRNLQDETATFTGVIQQTLSEIRLMKSSTAEPVEEKKGLSGIKKLFELGLREARVFALIGPLMYFVIMLVVVMIVGYGGIRVAEGSMSTGSLVAFLLYLFQIIMPVTTFATFFSQLQKAKGATERIIETLNLPLENEKEGLEKDIANQVIEMADISFAYSESEPVLSGISFKAQPGEMIAFSGPSGGGKTTLFSLIERYYEPTQGEIKIGDTPIGKLSLRSWRSQIGYVSQESAMMAGTIRENLTYGLEAPDTIPDDRLWEVARLAYADQFIQSFADGLDTKVGERGANLSGGQKQRISIARAFLRDPKILMMDEATASLDSQSEGVVQKALVNLMKGRTTLVIAHRLSTIVNADKIIFIEDGQITGAGTHQELVHSHELYRQFADQQLS